MKERVRLQNSGDYDEIFIMIADAQALTDNAEHPEKVRQNIIQVALDYLACGIDPAKSTIFIQSMVPELTELTFYYMNLHNAVSYTHLYNVNDIVDGLKGRKFGFEETIYLLMFGRLPSDKDMEIFKNIMASFETLSGRFVRDVVMKASNSDIMNAMQRCIHTLSTYDSKPADISAENVIQMCIRDRVPSAEQVTDLSLPNSRNCLQ